VGLVTCSAWTVLELWAAETAKSWRTSELFIRLFQNENKGEKPIAGK